MLSLANNPLWKEQNILQAVVMDHFIVGWPLQLHPASWRLPGLGNFSANFQFCHQHIEAPSRISNWKKSFLDQLLNPLANYMINNLGWVQWVLLYKHWSYKASQLPKFSTRSEYKWDYCRQWIFKTKTLDSTFF